MDERQVVKMLADDIVAAIRKINEENNLGYVDSKIRNTPALVNPDSLYSVLDANRIKGLGAYVGDKIENATIDGSQITGIVNPNSISITTAQIQDLEAEVADIAKAEIENADIEVAQIDELDAYVATISKAEIENASIDAAQIQDLEAATAEILNANIGNAKIDWAQIKGLDTETLFVKYGNTDKLYAKDLYISEAQILSLIAGNLLLQDSNGNLSRIYIDENGNVKTVKYDIDGTDIKGGSIDGSAIKEGTTITAGTVNTDSIQNGAITTDLIKDGSITTALISDDAIVAKHLAVEEIFGTEILASKILASDINVSDLFASEAFIGKLQTSIITGVSTEGDVPAQIELNKNISVNANNVYISADESINMSVAEKMEDFDTGIGGLDTRLKQAEAKITDDEIVLAVTSSSTYQKNIIHQGDKPPEEPEDGMLWLDISAGAELKRYAYSEEEGTYVWTTASDSGLSTEINTRHDELIEKLDATSRNIDDKLKNQNEALEQKIENLVKETGDLSVRANEIVASFTQEYLSLDDTAKNLAGRVTTIESHVTIEPNAKVTLSSSAESAKTMIDPNGLKIADKADRVLANFTSDGASVPKITIVERMSLGNLMWVVHNNKTSSIMAN